MMAHVPPLRPEVRALTLYRLPAFAARSLTVARYGAAVARFTSRPA